jgi:hypothetical protein
MMKITSQFFGFLRGPYFAMLHPGLYLYIRKLKGLTSRALGVGEVILYTGKV